MQSFLWWMAQNTVATAVLIGVLSLASCLLKSRPALVHALWVVVLLKFLTPPVIAWPWSVEQMVAPIWSSERTVQTIRTGEAAAVGDGSASASILRSSSAGDSRREPASTSCADCAPGAELEHSAQPFQLARPPAPPRTWAHLLVVFWMAGTVIVVLIQARRLISFHRLVGQARPAPSRLSAEVEQVARQLAMRPLPTKLAGRVATPFVWCLGRLQLIWPEILAGDTDVGRYRGVIAHELAHVKRRDHWIAWLELSAGCLWWWNPLFWYMRRQLRETADLACDAHVVNTGADRRAYAEMFLELSGLVSQGQTPAPALGVSTGARRTVERRLSMILNENAKAKVSVADLWPDR